VSKGDTERRANQGHGESGFTLLEVLVAVAILSLLSLATMRLAGIGADTARHVRGKTHALIVAENALVDALLDPTIARGKTRSAVSNMGQTWQVTRSVSPMPDARVLRVEITVMAAASKAGASIESFKVLGDGE
jgi:general secretion pathway protein I